MNWLKKYITKNSILGAIATTVAAAGAIVAAPVALPAALVAVATKIVVYGTTAGIIAAKVLPGNGRNAPEKPAEFPKP